MLVKCQACGQEIEAYLRKKGSAWVACPLCKKKFTTGEVPREYIKDVDKYPWEEAGVEGGEKEVRGELFEVPKEVHEIVAEVLSEYGCAEPFIKSVTKYIERKGYFDAQWLFNMLLRARTGRRFTEEEAYLVVDEIISAIESERRKAESIGRPFGFTVVPFQSTHTPFYYTQPYPQIPVPTHAAAPITQPVPQQPPTMPYQYQSHQLPYPQLTKDEVVKIIRDEISKLIAEKRTVDEISELRRKVTEEVPKQVDEKLEKQRAEMMNFIKESINEIKSLISSIQKPAAEVEEITKKDLELMRESISKELIERVHEAERKVLEERLKAIESKLEEKKQPIIPPSSEGYKEDGFRLVADTIKTVVRPGEWYPGRAVSEIIVKLVPTTPPPERKEIVSEKSIVDKLKEAGGVVE